jgi:hypothetical protein
MTGLDPVEPPDFPWTTLARKAGRAQPRDEDEPKPQVRAVEMTRGGKLRPPSFPPRLEIPHKARDSHISTAPATASLRTEILMTNWT